MDVCSADGSWVEIGPRTPPPPPRPAGLDAELQQRVIAFNAGDEKYSAEWLTNFQRSEGAWQICVQALRTGPGASYDEWLLQEFCAQTLARLARSFGARHRKEAQRQCRDDLEVLLALHSQNRSPVWKQLALAFTCADLWLGTWTPAPALSAPTAAATGASGLPPAVRLELLALPVELLFCDRALPLDDPLLRQAAASALLDASTSVLPFLCSNAPIGEEGKWLRVMASWVRALRKCLRQLPTRDEAAPLRCLAEHWARVAWMSQESATDAAELAQELARWRCCHEDLAKLLSGILDNLFEAYFDDGRQVLIPLLAELAADCWPRAAVGDLSLNWELIGENAVLLVREAIEGGDAAVDAEAALEVWRTFSVTLRDGVQEQTGLPHIDQVPPVDGIGLTRPEKQRRLCEAWCPSRERVAKAEALPRLFSGFAKALLEFMSIRADAEEESLTALWEHRKTAQGVLGAWAWLVAEDPTWQEATWGPLRSIGQILSNGAGHHNGDVWREAEVVFWFSSALASSWPSHANSVPVASAVPQLRAIDAAPAPWRALLWASASGLAATAPVERCLEMVEWMLQHCPAAAGSPELMTLTELPHAHALEKVCRGLSGDNAHIQIAERLVALAFADRPTAAIHPDTPRVQTILLRAMRHVMGCNSSLLCQGLASSILPGLRGAVDREQALAEGADNPQWLAAQALFATLATSVPAGEPEAGKNHPAVALWQSNWEYVRKALSVWPSSSSTDEPQLSAAQALTVAVLALPYLLFPAVQLLTESIAKSDPDHLPELQLTALREIVHGVKCPSDDSFKAAQVLAQAVLDTCDKLLHSQQALVETPSALAAFFDLLAEAVRASPPGSSVAPCDDQLRPLLLAQPLRFTSRALDLWSRALPTCTSPAATGAMLRFVARLAGSEQGEHVAAHRSVFAAALPELCRALCSALASQGHLTELEALAPAAELLLHVKAAYPLEFPSALAAGAQHVQVTEWSRARLPGVLERPELWLRKGEWLEQLQQVVLEWQRELRHVTM